MNNQIRKSNCIYNLIFGITTFCTVISSTNLVSAQITPDNTLPNNSEIGIEGNITKINGGTTAGSNLFHSFEKFGVSTDTEAHFNNATDIQNIFTRVTGKSFSDIDGLIKANGAANLFLINPHGIVFGENARLDIGGSFVGSAADSFKFPGNVEFSAVNPQQSPLLSVNLPVGLQSKTNLTNLTVEENRVQTDLNLEDVKVEKTLRIQDMVKVIPNTIPVDTKITNTCSIPGYAQSSFTITGKGSLPPSPFEPLTGRLNQTKLAILDKVEETKLQRSRINKKSEIKQIVEAQGWIRNKNGEIFLVANPPQHSNIQTMKNPNYCS
ncbi:filamentous hemagglutinin outer membrane protein [Calothrix parasitica NIES-267]|uniref:Filamentous hemagglutinin outer membrane protein n=1 Tax=Calothrix parasitica NIES-267 TaxID=1973488 RepID=A0A1Z4LJA0_9CYAN|nr:filamentous hemagglutinin outer membrane protein [Calothrix parasitica NIES-267]